MLNTTHSTLSKPAAPRFAAFQHRNFRLFWAGNFISQIGSMAQVTAQGWLVRELTPDPRLITVVAACGTLPVIFLSLYAGAIADRVDRRRTLLVFNIIAALMALALAALIWLQIVQVWHVIAFSLASGVFVAFDIPIRQSFNRDMVGRNDLPSAITLNGTAFNTARVAGPAIGGTLIHNLGLAGSFFVNAFSFVAIIVGLALMSLPAHQPSHSRMSLLTIWKGVLFVRRHETLRLVILLVSVVSFGAMSFGSLLPIFARDIFNTDARGFSILMTSNGLGALFAASSMAFMRTMRHKGKRVLAGAWLFCLATFGFAVSPNLLLACICLILSGYFLLMFLMTANTLVQTLSPDSLRGRIFSIYSLGLIGGNPVGAIVLGTIAHWYGARLAVATGTLLASLFVLYVFWKFRGLWKQK